MRIISQQNVLDCNVSQTGYKQDVDMRKEIVSHFYDHNTTFNTRSKFIPER